MNDYIDKIHTSAMKVYNNDPNSDVSKILRESLELLYTQMKTSQNIPEKKKLTDCISQESYTLEDLQDDLMYVCKDEDDDLYLIQGGHGAIVFIAEHVNDISNLYSLYLDFTDDEIKEYSDFRLVFDPVRVLEIFLNGEINE